MGNKQLQCLFIGGRSEIYADLLHQLNTLKLNIQVKQAGLKDSVIASSLKRCSGACLVVLSDTVNFSLEKLSDLVWRYSSDAIILIVTKKTGTTALKNPFNATQIAKLYIDKEGKESSLFLQYIVEYVFLKAEFRRCKRLLGTSEKRCQWLVDTSREPVAYISRQIHLYANAAYLELFGINSIEHLQAMPVQELITKDEYPLYKSFINKQVRHHPLERSLVLSMKRLNGSEFRASLHAIPTVFKGKNSIQLWVHPIGKDAFSSQETRKQNLQQHATDKQTNTNSKLMEKQSERDENPFAVLKKASEETKEKNKKATQKKLKPVNSSFILREILKRKEAKIITHKLELMDHNKGLPEQNLLVSLVVAAAQRQGINDLLFRSIDAHSKDKQLIFWDKVKLLRLLQILFRKKLDANLYISLSDASVSSDAFISWLIPGLKKLGYKASKLTFLLPCQKGIKQRRSSLSLIQALRSCGCKVGFDEFKATRVHIDALKSVRPNVVRLSLPWVREIEGSEKRELALGRLVRKLEANNIRVIAPCGFSYDMKKLFALAGASFCQEKATKTA